MRIRKGIRRKPPKSLWIFTAIMHGHIQALLGLTFWPNTKRELNNRIRIRIFLHGGDPNPGVQQMYEKVD